MNLRELRDGGILGEVRRNGTYHALVYFGFTFCTGVILSLGIAFYGAMLNAPDAAFLSALIFISFGMAAFVFGVFVLMSTGEKMGDAVKKGFDLVDAEITGIKHKYALPELPAELPLPTDPRLLPVTTPERVGEIPVELTNGFDYRDLDYFALYLSNGNPYSETRLEKQHLPYQKILFGGLTPGTPLTRLLDLCEQRGIMSARDSEHRKPGKLLLNDEKEIARLLKLPQE